MKLTNNQNSTQNLVDSDGGKVRVYIFIRYIIFFKSYSHKSIVKKKYSDHSFR